MIVITQTDAEKILNFAASVEWDVGLDEDEQQFVDRIIAAFPNITVPDILVHS